MNGNQTCDKIPTVEVILTPSSLLVEQASIVAINSDFRPPAQNISCSDPKAKEVWIVVCSSGADSARFVWPAGGLDR